MLKPSPWSVLGFRSLGLFFQQTNAPDAVVQKLITRAFYIRFVLANHLTGLCNGPWNDWGEQTQTP